MTIKECIDIVDNTKPNQYSIKDKVMWLSFIDEIIINEVLKTHEGYDGRYDNFSGHTEDKLSVPLIVPSPYDRLYTAYLKMKIDGENGETTRYNNSVTLFNTYMMEYRKYYNKTHMPLSVSDRNRHVPKKHPSNGVSEAEYEKLKRELYAALQEDFSEMVSDDKIYDIVTNYVNNNVEMLKGKDGIDGKDGINGRDGIDGINGKDGYTPIKGIDYFDGEQGVQGQQGLQGEKGNTGEKGDRGEKGNTGISFSHVNTIYYLSDSPTEMINGEEMPSPTWQEGRYLWVKFIFMRDDGINTITPPVCVSGMSGATGEKGEQGDKGETGVGIASIKTEYYKSTQVGSLTGGEWTDTYQGWQSYRYLWTRQTFTFTNGETFTTEPICVQGNQGATGEKGEQGADGYTPIKGTDYYTEEDKTEMVNAVISALPKYAGEVV